VIGLVIPVIAGPDPIDPRPYAAATDLLFLSAPLVAVILVRQAGGGWRDFGAVLALATGIAFLIGAALFVLLFGALLITGAEV
jgi:hypothetical protein